MNRLPWKTLAVHLGVDGPALTGSARLAVLFLWLRKEAPLHVVVRDADGLVVANALAVNWANFPLQTALEAALAWGAERR